MALSHVWGGVPVFQATKSNAKRFECDNSLRKEQAPQVIEDAMDFVEAFGEQYLWVDCLF